MGIVGQATNNNLGSRFMYEMKNGRLKSLTLPFSLGRGVAERGLGAGQLLAESTGPR
jgi:hypothetical protein